MKIGIIADVHGNHPALTSVLRSGVNKGVDRWFVLGDLVGYYYWPSEVIDEVMSLNAQVISGNHERLLADGVRDEVFLEGLVKKYGSGYRTAVEQLSRSQLNWLASLDSTLRTTCNEFKVFLCHGSPWSLDSYIYKDSPASVWEKFQQVNSDFVFFGHSHYAINRRIGKTMVVNPGSVGQPRDRKGGAQWALWDSKGRYVDFYREDYDVSSVITECMLRDPMITYLTDVFGS